MSTDLCAAALLNDLATLDHPPSDFTSAERRALLTSAKETLSWLVTAGGGPFDLETLARIDDALDRALAGAR